MLHVHMHMLMHMCMHMCIPCVPMSMCAHICLCGPWCGPPQCQVPKV